MYKSSKLKWAMVFVFLFILVVLMREKITQFLLYPAPAIQVPQNPPSPLLPMMVSVSNNIQVQCWYHYRQNSQPWLIYFHGNGENLQTLWLSGIFKEFEKLGVNYLAMEYPGYGNNRGNPNEKSLLQSARVVMEKVQTDFHAEKIILFGWSLGAAVAIQTAINQSTSLKGLILASPWWSLEAVAKEHYPNWLVNLFLTERYESFSVAPLIDMPVLIIHGSKDEIIPIQHGQRLSTKFSHLFQMMEIPQAHHGDLLSFSTVWETLSAFILHVTTD